MTDPMQEFAIELLEKRAELAKKEAIGEITIDQAEIALVQWYQENIPTGTIDIRSPDYPAGSPKALAEDYRTQRMNKQLAREHPPAYQEACILAADALAAAVLND